MHAGSAVGEDRYEAALRQLHERLLPVLDGLPDDGPRLLIEPTAGGGKALAATVEDLGPYFAALEHHPLVGVCFDTCHAWAAGHDLAVPGGMTATLDALEATVGPGRLGLVHANDSSTSAAPSATGTPRSARARSGRRRSASCSPTRRWPASRWWWRRPASSTARRRPVTSATSPCCAAARRLTLGATVSADAQFGAELRISARVAAEQPQPCVVDSPDVTSAGLGRAGQPGVAVAKGLPSDGRHQRVAPDVALALRAIRARPPRPSRPPASTPRRRRRGRRSRRRPPRGAAARTSACRAPAGRAGSPRSPARSGSRRRAARPARQLGPSVQPRAARQLVGEVRGGHIRRRTAVIVAARAARPERPTTPRCPPPPARTAVTGSPRSSPLGVGVARPVHDHARRASTAHARFDGDVHRTGRVVDELPQGQGGRVAGHSRAPVERSGHSDPPVPRGGREREDYRAARRTSRRPSPSCARCCD